jgi:hypothetical protein
LGKVLHGLFIWEIKSIPNYSAKIEPLSQLLRSSKTGAKIYGTQQIGSYISLSEFAGLEM